jgi:hypothetical protein
LIDEMTTTRPKLRLRMPSMTGRVMLNKESRLVRITADHCSLVMRWKNPSRVMPALLTRISTGPTALSTCFTPAAQASKSPTSHLKTGMPVSDLNLFAASSLPA